MSKVNDIVLLHGWGLNSAIWRDFTEALRSKRPDLTVHQLDMPGYGRNVECGSTPDLQELARFCLARAPQQALWVGWSLGGLVAMQAALLEKDRVQGLQLLCSTPRFTHSDDWPSGMDLPIFEQFSADLARDYHNTLTSFLLLQAGSNTGARDLARAAHQAICALPAPSPQTLSDGIACLANTDLRDRLTEMSLPSQVISGRLDRVIRPASSVYLAKALGAELLELHAGHMPFISHQADALNGLLSLVARIDGHTT